MPINYIHAPYSTECKSLKPTKKTFGMNIDILESDVVKIKY